jgi:hypothetical protein
MPGKLILEVAGTQVAYVDLKGTATQIRTVIRRYADSIGISTTGMSDGDVGKAVLDRYVLTVKDTSMAKQRTEKFAELAASIEAQLELDNNIY